MWKSLISWLDWVIHDWRMREVQLNELAAAQMTVQSQKAEIIALQSANIAFLDRIASLEHNQRLHTESLAMLAAEVDAKSKPNVRHTPRNWSEFRKQVQGGGNAA